MPFVRVVLLLVLVGLAATSCQNRAAAEDDIREAVFRYQFEYLGPLENADYYFIRPASEEFLARFEGETPTVLPESEAVRSPEGVTHWKHGGKGLSFRTDRVLWLDRNTADVEGGYFQAGLSSSDNIYRVEYKNENWTVTKDTLISQS